LLYYYTKNYILQQKKGREKEEPTRSRGKGGKVITGVAVCAAVGAMTSLLL